MIMREILFVACVLAVTVYLAVTAWEDHKTCEVTRWKHLIGGIPAIYLLCSQYGLSSLWEYAILLAFSAVYVLAGCMGVYGMADGYVLAILNLFFSGIGGLAGGGIVVLIMIVAGFSFLIAHLIECMVKRKKLFRNMAAAFVPHILIGYIVAWIGLFLYTV